MSFIDGHMRFNTTLNDKSDQGMQAQCQEQRLTVCSHGTITTAIFLLQLNRLHGIQCKYSHGAIETTTLNPIQPSTNDIKSQTQSHRVNSP